MAIFVCLLVVAFLIVWFFIGLSEAVIITIVLMVGVAILAWIGTRLSVSADKNHQAVVEKPKHNIRFRARNGERQFDISISLTGSSSYETHGLESYWKSIFRTFPAAQGTDREASEYLHRELSAVVAQYNATTSHNKKEGLKAIITISASKQNKPASEPSTEVS